jgi:signal transduction histidine kinase
LGRVPVEDPVDRRNAPMLQVVLLLLGLTPPLMWLYRAFASPLPWRDAETIGVIVSSAVSAVALFGVVLVRRGRFQWAARQLLAVIALSMLVAYAGAGFDAQRHEQPLLVVWIALAGLMIGRRALWSMYACIVAAFLIGYVNDWFAFAAKTDVVSDLVVDCVINCLVYLLIAVVVDRSVLALRGALAEANRRGDELALANRRLEAEMAERAKVQEQLIHAQKVEAIGRLASGVAHDFNHLLGLVLGYAGRADVDDPAARKKALEGIESAARRATSVTRKLLHFGRRDVASIESFDVAQVVRELQPMLRQLFDPAVRIVCDPGDAAFLVAFDRAQFELVLLNIAANANHAMPDGGEFHVVIGRTSDGGVELCLRDTGHGMEDSVRERIFEGFFTTKPPGEGMGLGLAVAADVIAAAGGSISVDSAPGRGATFRIRLPAVMAAGADDADTPSVTRIAASGFAA